MSAFGSHRTGSTDYDLRSLQHERRMLAQYRQTAPRDAALLQPLANACWRAASFEWKLYQDAETTRRLWGESARALAQGFTRRRPGFDPSPDQFTLALHLAIAARERDAFTSLAMTDSNFRSGALREARAFRGSRALFHLAEGYALVSRALVERAANAADAAQDTLASARAESERSWWEAQFPDARDAAWRISEHEAVCALLCAVARRLSEFSPHPVHTPHNGDDEANAREFSLVIDEALLRLDEFVASDPDHHPKLYVWLPGIALCALASSAGLPMQWLNERIEAGADGYSRLPKELLRNTTARD